MKKYCLIENGKITIQPTTLPVNWNNISNFHVLDDETLKAYGWLPVETISENKEIFVSSSLEIFDDKVVETIITRDKTEEEIEQEKIKREKEINELKWQKIRTLRDSLLKKSDILTLSDIWENKSEEEKQKIKEYREKLRNLPQNYIKAEGVIFPNL
jgi:hypothetical protein